jgi:hypothetical protein
MALGDYAGRNAQGDHRLYIDQHPEDPGESRSPTNDAIYIDGEAGVLHLGRPTGSVVLRGTVIGASSPAPVFNLSTARVAYAEIADRANGLWSGSRFMDGTGAVWSVQYETAYTVTLSTNLASISGVRPPFYVSAFPFASSNAWLGRFDGGVAQVIYSEGTLAENVWEGVVGDGYPLTLTSISGLGSASITRLVTTTPLSTTRVDRVAMESELRTNLTTATNALAGLIAADLLDLASTIPTNVATRIDLATATNALAGQIAADLLDLVATIPTNAATTADLTEATGALSGQIAAGNLPMQRWQMWDWGVNSNRFLILTNDVIEIWE